MYCTQEGHVRQSWTDNKEGEKFKDFCVFMCIKGSERSMKAYLTDMGLLCVQPTERGGHPAV